MITSQFDSNLCPSRNFLGFGNKEKPDMAKAIDIFNMGGDELIYIAT